MNTRFVKLSRYGIAVVLLSSLIQVDLAWAGWPWSRKGEPLSIKQKLDPEDDSESYSCRLEQREFETPETCYDVEREVICIPKVVLPWQRATGGKLSSTQPEHCAACDSNHRADRCRVRQVKRVTPKVYQKLDVRPVWVPIKTGQPAIAVQCPSCDDGLGFLRTDGMLESSSTSLNSDRP